MALPTLFLTITKVFNLSLSRGLTVAYAFIEHAKFFSYFIYVKGHDFICNQNPEYRTEINLHFPNHAHTHTLTCTVLIISIADHSPWVSNQRQAEEATGGNSDSKQRQQAALATAQTIGSGHQAAGGNPDSKQRQQ